MRRRCPGQGEESCGESRNNKRFCNYCVRRWLLEDKVGEGLSAAKGCLRGLGVEVVGHGDGL